MNRAKVLKNQIEVLESALAKLHLAAYAETNSMDLGHGKAAAEFDAKMYSKVLNVLRQMDNELVTTTEWRGE